MTLRNNRSTTRIRLQQAAFRAFVSAFAATALSGCALLGGGKSGGSATIYAPEVRVAADPGWPTVAWSLTIAPPSAEAVVELQIRTAIIGMVKRVLRIGIPLSSSVSSVVHWRALQALIGSLIGYAVGQE